MDEEDGVVLLGEMDRLPGPGNTYGAVSRLFAGTLASSPNLGVKGTERSEDEVKVGDSPKLGELEEFTLGGGPDSPPDDDAFWPMFWGQEWSRWEPGTLYE